MSREEFLTQRLAERSTELYEAQQEIERLKAERQKLDRRIRNQRRQLRMDWQILESRINFISRITKEGRSSYLAQISRWRDRALAAEARLKEIA